MRTSLPETGMAREGILDQMKSMRKGEPDWRGGRLFGVIYYLSEDLLRLATEAYGMFLSESASKPRLWPSLRRLEEEIVDMALELFNAGAGAGGTVTSGGTESIFLAVQAAREWAREIHVSARAPEIVAPRSAHPAFDRAAQYLGLKVKRIPVCGDFRADVSSMEAAITGNTIMLVASAPGYPHGIMDPVSRLAALARKHNVWLHVDACHGFLAPFVKMIGYPIPEFDFAVSGVTTLSVDLHKWGFAPKGASIILHQKSEFQKFHLFDFDAWQAGRYRSFVFAGTRTGGSVAAAWAVMKHLGRQGYQEIARTVMRTKQQLIEGINAIDGLKVFGEPELGIITFGSDICDILAVADGMNNRNWHMARIVEPPGIHVVVSPQNSQVVDEFLADLEGLTRDVRTGQMQSREKPIFY